ncbi:Rho guanine nucleotide exchange factor 1 isoform 1 [Schistosoma japonicum]|uniref:Rho guanine nucleotide exchange factor 1 isoform 1 n=2 Tax=Schistosoma japonicum TaxID=6182 RepID=A0A4Z2CUM4_SCHJA|nr:Rho guanine nucleotide exchange factor 1 isoform 1 [Schistosoma japonicum]
MYNEAETSTTNTIRVITIRSKSTSCQEDMPSSPLKSSDTSDSTTDQDSNTDSIEDEQTCINNKIRNFLDSTTTIFELIDQTSYLQKYPSWLGFLGPENKKKYAPTYINRNDNIWELVFSERGYVDMLLIVRDLYMIPFPKIDSHSVNGLPTDNIIGNSDLCTALFPCINELVESHEKIFRILAGLHLERDDHIVSSLGAYLVQLFDTECLSSLSQLYGNFLYAQKRIRQRLQACRNHPQISAFFQQVKQNPRCARKSLEDCYMVIVQRWTKVETLLESIIRNTLNDDKEVMNLETARNSVKSIIKSAESILTDIEYAEKLKEFANCLNVPTSSTTMMSLISPSSNFTFDEVQLLNELKSHNTKLINHGPLYVNPMVAGSGLQSGTSYEVEGVALKNCFFMLQKIPDSNRYQLFRGTEMPPILWWGKVYGYFRKSMEKGSFGFYILLHSATALTLFRCATVDELARWETIFNDGFSQWREHMDTYESLSEEFSKSRNEITEKQKRTEAILELLYQLNDGRLKFWKIWEFVSSVLINERLAEMNLLLPKPELQQRPAISSTPGSSSRGSVKVNVTSPPITPNNNAQYIATMDTLKLNTFISNLDAYNDLDQIFHLLHEYFHRLSFALLTGPSSNLSRSASDVDGSKRPQINVVKKHETFSAHDNLPVSNELRSSIDVGHIKSKKRDVHRLSATMASIFRTPNRDKSFTSNSQLSTDHSTNGYNMNTTGTHKSMKQRQPLSSLSTAATSSRVQQQISCPPPLPPRPPLTILGNLNLSGVNEQLSPSSQSSFNPDSLIDGTNSLILGQPSSEALLLLGELNQIAGALFPQVQLLRTENVELRSTVAKLEAERSNWEHFRNRDTQLTVRTSMNGSVSHTGGIHSDNISSSSGFIDNTTVKQETEKLRQDYEHFTKKCHDWEKEYQKQRSAIEREHNKIAKERQLLENERADLEHRQRLYEELRSTLQAQLNIYKKMGIKLTPINTNPELQELQANFNSDIPDSQLNRSGSSIMTNSFDDYLNELSGNNSTDSNNRGSGCSGTTNEFSKPVHFYSNSDDITVSRHSSTAVDSKRNHAHSPLDVDITLKPSLVPSSSTRSDNVPEHLRGSLVNQNNIRGQPNNLRSSEPLTDFNTNDRSFSEISSSGINSSININNNTNSTNGKSVPNSSLFSDSNPLMKLVDHTKVRSSSSSLGKSKKSYRSRSRQKNS